MGNGVYSIIFCYSGKVIEIFENLIVNGVNIDLWNYWGGLVQ